MSHTRRSDLYNSGLKLGPSVRELDMGLVIRLPVCIAASSSYTGRRRGTHGPLQLTRKITIAQCELVGSHA